MNITITGRHMHVHDSVRDYVTEKATKLERYNDAISHIEITVGNDGDRKVVEMIATSRVGGKHVAREEHQDVFAAVDLLIDKMKRQVEKTKEKKKQRKHGESARHMTPSELGTLPTGKKDEEDLESYDDVIEKMEL